LFFLEIRSLHLSGALTLGAITAAGLAVLLGLTRALRGQQKRLSQGR
jgi:hypothetical protein